MTNVKRAETVAGVVMNTVSTPDNIANRLILADIAQSLAFIADSLAEIQKQGVKEKDDH